MGWGWWSFPRREIWGVRFGGRAADPDGDAIGAHTFQKSATLLAIMGEAESAQIRAPIAMLLPVYMLIARPRMACRVSDASN